MRPGDAHAGHAQRFRDAFGEQLRIGLAVHGFEHAAGDDVIAIVVVEALARLIAHCAGAHGIGQHARARAEGGAVAGIAVGQARCVAKQHADRDLLARRPLEGGQIAGDRRIQIKPAGRDILHRDGGGDLLGYRCPAPAVAWQEIGWRAGADHALWHLGAKAFFQRDLAAFRQQHDASETGHIRRFGDPAGWFWSIEGRDHGDQRNHAARLPGLMAGMASSSGGSASGW